MSDIRTDLAVELHENAVKKLDRDKIDGINIKVENKGFFKISRINISEKSGSDALNKPMGNYVTFEFGRVGVGEKEKFYSLCDCVSREIKKLIYGKCGKKPKKVLVIGLGNADITADSVGPSALKSVLVTGHIKRFSREIFEDFGGVEILALSTGVMAQTGMESADIAESVCRKAKPDVVIAVDALASGDITKLASSIQITDTGICPGGGIGNNRMGINEELLGVPVISVGVPTMVEIGALVCDAMGMLDTDNSDKDEIRKRLGKSGEILVTPKDCGIIISDTAKLIGFAIDRAVAEEIGFDELARLVN